LHPRKLKQTNSRVAKLRTAKHTPSPTYDSRERDGSLARVRRELQFSPSVAA